MPTTNLQKGITALETRLKHFEKLFDQSIKNNEVLAKTKVILNEVKRLSEKLNELKRTNGIK
jgi:hypothetical protein